SSSPPSFAGRWQGGMASAAHTAPVPSLARQEAARAQPSPKPKRPRVSFATVSLRTFATGEDGSLSSPQERQLSPMMDTSMSSEDKGTLRPLQIYNEQDTTEDLHFPGIRDLCAPTPDHLKAQRVSMSGELGDMQRQIKSALAPSPPAKHAMQPLTPIRHAEIENDGLNTGSDASGDMNEEVTANVESLAKLVMQDELYGAGRLTGAPVKGPAPGAAVRPSRGTPDRTPTAELEAF
ncbi:unnamed protein product, partial [Polarella glacialis]